MRRRKKPGAKDELLSYEKLVVKEPTYFKGDWRNLLKTDEIHIELGIGRGQFINTLAEKNNDIGYIGIEIKEEILLDAVKKTSEQEIMNIKYLWFNINDIDNIFDENEIDRIYINFCDPWPKKRHSKRRLTHKDFLVKYSNILKSKGEIHFKTDVEELFEFTLNEISDLPFLLLKNISLNLYRDEKVETVKTEYEEKFIAQRKNIYFLKAINNK